MSTINTLSPARGAPSIASGGQKNRATSRYKYWIAVVSLFLMPAMVQQAEARKPKKKDYCFENGCTGDKCIVCQR